jgi:hypothetical protein
VRELQGFDCVRIDAHFLLAPERPKGRSPDNVGAMIITASYKSHLQYLFKLYTPTEGLIRCHSEASESTVSKVISDKS